MTCRSRHTAARSENRHEVPQLGYSVEKLLFQGDEPKIYFKFFSLWLENLVLDWGLIECLILSRQAIARQVLSANVKRSSWAEYGEEILLTLQTKLEPFYGKGFSVFRRTSSVAQEQIGRAHV